MVEDDLSGTVEPGVEPEDPGYPPDQIELLSDTHIRNTLGPADGDAITLSLRDGGGS